ncbi:MAG: BamA/TamA family outer membrane protein [Elusimicrobia bacterium]|nr:BamA/TamA family outer membrane protein [Elusimicrobiota bacterium]
MTNVIGGNFSPVMSPDGSFMVFSSFRKGSMHVYRSDANALTPLASRAADDELFHADLASAVTEQFVVEPDTAEGPESYSFQASTDLFFPVLFYSSLDGLFAQLYWQGSEMLGNHQMQTIVGFASEDELLDYGFIYGYLKYKPQLYFGASGENYYEDIDKTERRRDHLQYVALGYPLSRYMGLNLQTGTIYRSRRYRLIDNLETTERENFVSTSLYYDITTGQYLDVQRGYRLRATYEQSDENIFNSDLQYRTHIFEGAGFVPLGPTVAAVRGFGGVSFGDDPGHFRLGGVDRVRGYPRDSDEYKASRSILVNAEWQVPLLRINYYVWFLFPDLFFKQINGVLFTDAGFPWDEGSALRDVAADDLMHSVGVGIRIFTFVLQTFRLDLNFDWAKRTTDGRDIFYFSIGPRFFVSVAYENRNRHVR